MGVWVEEVVAVPVAVDTSPSRHRHRATGLPVLVERRASILAAYVTDPVLDVNQVHSTVTEDVSIDLKTDLHREFVQKE